MWIDILELVLDSTMTDEERSRRRRRRGGGIAVAVVLLLGSFWLLVWNEGRAVRDAKTIEEGRSAVVSVGADRVDQANEGKLVHLSGQATTAEVLSDPQLGVSVNAILLRRKVEMYQWIEERQTRTERGSDGREKTVPHYSYRKDWSEQWSPSSAFHQRQGHENPPMPMVSDVFRAKDVKVGAFAVPALLRDKLKEYRAIGPTAEHVQGMPPDLRERTRIAGGQFHIRCAGGAGARAAPAAGPAMGAVEAEGPEATSRPVPATGPAVSSPATAADTSGQPQVGDLRVAVEAVYPGPVSILARQSGKTLAGYPAATGEVIYVLAHGVRSPREMFSAKMADSRTTTWLCRGGGFLMMFLGLLGIISPLLALADYLPLVGGVLRTGLALASLLLAVFLSLGTIAIGWVAYRPAVGVGLLAGAVGLLVLVRVLGPGKKKRMNIE